jgi:hypothetical protein
MPGMDGTGPLGQGPMTGGRRGRCVDEGTGQLPSAGYGRGAGFGRAQAYGRGAGPGRGGRGFRHQYNATGLTGWQRAQMDVASVVQAPRDERMERLEQRLDEALARLEQLEGTE